MADDPTPSAVLQHLAALSSAEEIFAFLAIDYRPEALNVSRLHVMKRFGSYLRETDLSGCSEAAVTRACREMLTRAYQDFITSTPLREKVFKVFRDEEAKQRARFVGLDTIKLAGH